MSETMSFNDYIDRFPMIADQIRETLVEVGDELDAKGGDDAMTEVMGLMIEVGKMQALQAIALGIQALIQKEN